MRELMLWLAGADGEVLARCSDRERTKLVGVGATVLTTGVLAVGAATYVTNTMLRAPFLLAIVVGLLWGAAIMNLDRWLQVTLRRQRSVVLTLMSGLPRVALAVIVGFVISEPLVLRVFEKEVEAQAVSNNQAALAADRKKLDRQYASIPVLEHQRDQLQTAVNTDTSGAVLQTNPEYQLLATSYQSLKDRFTSARENALCELDRTCGSRSGPNGRVYKAKKQLVDHLRGQVRSRGRALSRVRQRLLARERDRIQGSRAATTKQLATANADLAKLTSRKAEADTSLRQKYGAGIGLLDRVEALSDLTKNNGSLSAIRWMLQLLILCLDSLPVLVKMMMLFGKESVYDRLVDHIDENDYNAVVRTEDRRAEADEIDSRIIVDEAKVRRELQGAALRDLIKQVVDAQKAVAEKMISEWKAHVMAWAVEHVARARQSTPAAPGSNGTTKSTTPTP
jgi:hypothetical protein